MVKNFVNDEVYNDKISNSQNVQKNKLNKTIILKFIKKTSVFWYSENKLKIVVFSLVRYKKNNGI